MNRPLRYKVILTTAIVSIVLTSAGMMFASALPDGIEHLAKRLQIDFSTGSILHAPLRDYQVQMLGASSFSRIGAGLIGLLLVYFVCAIGSYLLTRTRRSYS